MIAGLFTALFAARLGLGVIPSLVASVAFMLSGPVLEAIYFVACLSTIAWLPAILWALQGLLSEPRLARAFVLAGVLAMAFLGGYAQGFLFELQVALAYGLLWLGLVARRGERMRVVMLAALGCVLAAGLSAAQLLPAIEVVGQAARAVRRLTLEEASPVSVSPRLLIDGLLGGRAAPRAFVCALLTLPLVLLGLADRKRLGHWLFFAVTALITGLFALGDATPVFPTYLALPFGDLFRIPSRISFVYAFALAVLVGIGAEGVMALTSRRGVGDWKALAAGLLLVLCFVGDIYVRSKLTHTLPVLSGETSYAPKEVIDYLANDRRDGRVFLENFGAHYSRALPYLIGMMNGIQAVPTYEPLIPASYAAYFAQEHLWRGFVNVVEYRGPRPFFLKVATVADFPPGVLARLLDLMSVRYYVTRRDLALQRLPELERFVGGELFTLGPAVLIERKQALPRVYTVHRVVTEPDTQRALAIIRAESFPPRQVAVVDRDVPSLGATSAARDTAAFRSYEAEEVSVDASCASPCLLVLTDLHYPGWEAVVDGESAPTYRVNTLFRGVHLSPGAHVVTYRYRPWSFRVGAALTGASLVLILAWALSHRRVRSVWLR